MMLLAIDSATNTVGIGLRNDHRILAEHTWHSNVHHTVDLAPEVALLLKREQVPVTALTGLAVASGPGSYTGLRIGMALAKGMALAHKLPLVGIPTIDILAQGQPPKETAMLALLPAGRHRFAGRKYSWTKKGWGGRWKAKNYSWEDVLDALGNPAYVCGTFSLEQRKALRKLEGIELAPPALCIRRPAVLADMAWEALKRGAGSDPGELAPTYLGSL